MGFPARPPFLFRAIMAGLVATFEPVKVQDSYLFDDEFTASNWRESVRESRIDTISRDRSMCRLKIVCDFEKYKSAVNFILGYSWVDGSKKLRRELPVFHPQWSWLFARAITNVTFLDFNGKAISSWKGSQYYATYAYAEIEIEFCETRYEVWADNEVTYEYERYVEVIPQPCAELVQIDGGQLKAYAPSVAALNGKDYIAAPHVIARQEKTGFEVIWREVPKEFLFDMDSSSATFGKAVKLAAMQKKVNSATFLGWRAGTLLCEEAVATVAPSPVATDLQSGLKFTYDVTFKVKGFDPTPGDSAVTKYGWNLLPGPRNTAGAAGSRFFSYYYFTHDGTVGGQPLFEEYAFANAFTHVTA